ncbi:uncharacterized protein [Branchiostoma lanceolatum]|uniref:uncharacterized protein n=1 Tax=Branchiostoma lanceolatum TaxID=7740 RepID=UPI003455A9FB
MMAALTVAVGLLLGTIATISDGARAPTFVQHPPSTVRGTRGDNLLLTVVVNGTDELDPIVIQGPNPITGSNKLVPIFERGTGQENPHEPFKGNFSVSTDWSGGVTVVNMTILDVQSGDEGTYMFSMAFHAGPGINVTVNELNGHNDGVTVNTTVTGSKVNTTESTGSGEGLTGGAIAGIVIGLVIAAMAVAGIYLYKRRNSGIPPPDPQIVYVPVDKEAHDNGDVPGAQEPNGVGRHGREDGPEEV